MENIEGTVVANVKGDGIQTGQPFLDIEAAM